MNRVCPLLDDRCKRSELLRWWFCWISAESEH